MNDPELIARSLAFVPPLILAASLSLAAQKDMAQSGTWAGVILNNCTADEAFAEAAKCTEYTPVAKPVLFDDTTRQVFNLEPQVRAAGHLGDSVIVRGVLESGTIRVSSLELLTSIGLAVGHKAPPFSARDQFGKDQTLDTLKGPHGTVLLFFRSADW
jgi:hypothetical protein